MSGEYFVVTSAWRDRWEQYIRQPAKPRGKVKSKDKSKSDSQSERFEAGPIDTKSLLCSHGLLKYNLFPYDTQLAPESTQKLDTDEVATEVAVGEPVASSHLQGTKPGVMCLVKAIGWEVLVHLHS